MYDFAADTGMEDVASQDAMLGPSSQVNQQTARGASAGTPTRALVMLWFAALFLLWGMGYLLRRQLS